MGEVVAIGVGVGQMEADAGRDAAGRFVPGRQSATQRAAKAAQAERTAARIAAGEPNRQSQSRKRNFEAKLAAEAEAAQAARDADASRWTAVTRDAFLGALAESGNVASAARVAGMPTRGAYYVRARNADFRAQWAEALETFINQVEANVLGRIADGFDKPVFYQGQQCGAERVFNDGVGINYLKARRPEAYGAAREAEVQAKLPGKAGEKGRLTIEAMMADLATRVERGQ